MMRRFTGTVLPAIASMLAATLAVAGPLTFTRVDTPVGAQPNSIVTADFNGDGALDLAVAHGPSDTLSVFLGNGHGGFTHSLDLDTGAYPLSLHVTDANHDGAADLVTGNHHAGSVTVLLGNGDGTFQPARQFVASTTWGLFDWGYSGTPVSIDVADYNGDGHVDIAVPLRGYSMISLLLGAGDGTFATLIEAASSGCDDPQAVAAADFGGDGIQDMAIASDWWCQAIRPGVGGGVFDPMYMNYFPSPNSKSVNVADLNGDTRPDLVFANSWATGVSVHLGDGANGFLPRSEYASGLRPEFVTTADLDGDGRRDILSANTGENTVSVLFGDGTGGVASTVTFPTGAAPTRIATGDFNKDGMLDFAVSNEADGTVSVFLTSSSCGLDRMPPVIDSVTATPPVLWPPRRRLEPVTLDVIASDACSAVTCRIVSVESNEPTSRAGDWVITGDLMMELRSERSGRGAGREYRVTIECGDAAGNASQQLIVVSVRHDSRR